MRKKLISVSVGCSVQTSHACKAGTDVFFVLVDRLCSSEPFTSFSGFSLKTAAFKTVPGSREASVQEQQLEFQEENVNTTYFTRSRWQAHARRVSIFRRRPGYVESTRSSRALACLLRPGQRLRCSRKQFGSILSQDQSRLNVLLMKLNIKNL